MKLHPCISCGSNSVIENINFGEQPICNRFLSTKISDEYKHPLVIGQCNVCALVQLINPVPPSELMPHYEWITYNEPEEHLDELAGIISTLPSITKTSKVCGITFKDDSLLYRLKNLGIQNIYRLNPLNDLNIIERNAGIETIQHCLNIDTSEEIAKKHGRFDIVIARHILEHTHDIKRFISSLKQLVKTDGYIVFEVPDCSRAIEDLDYTTIWEEHTMYFTQETFKRSVSINNLAILRYECYPHPFENSLVIISGSHKASRLSSLSQDILQNEKNRMQKFSRGFPKYRGKLKNYLSEYKKNKGSIVMFGAGHLACAYINFMDLKDIIKFVVDDNPKKARVLMPGSQLPIYNSQILLNNNIKLCLLSLSLTKEDKVISNNRDFTNQGGVFMSIFPASKYAIKL